MIYSLPPSLSPSLLSSLPPSLPPSPPLPPLTPSPSFPRSESFPPSLPRPSSSVPFSLGCFPYSSCADTIPENMALGLTGAVHDLSTSPLYRTKQDDREEVAVWESVRGGGAYSHARAGVNSATQRRSADGGGGGGGGSGGGSAQIPPVMGSSYEQYEQAYQHIYASAAAVPAVVPQWKD